MKPYAWTFVAVTLSAVTAFVVARQVSGPSTGSDHDHHHESGPPSGPEGGSFHDWLHEQLAITPQQEADLAPIEKTYAEKRTDLLAQVEMAGLKLAAALDGAPVNRGEIDAALTEIHASQGELQQITIGHFLEMKEHLSPEQAEKLLQWTRQSITHEHRP